MCCTLQVGSLVNICTKFLLPGLLLLLLYFPFDLLLLQICIRELYAVSCLFNFVTSSHFVLENPNANTVEVSPVNGTGMPSVLSVRN